MNIKVNSRPLSWLCRNLKLSAEESDRFMEEAMFRIGALFFRTVRHYTPVDTGYLKAHWFVDGSGKKLRIHNETRYLKYVEEGTYKMAPRYFVKRSIAEAEPKVQVIVENTIKDLFSRF